MNIVVCAKAVPSSTEVKMDPQTNTIVRDGRAAVVNPFDATALELALRIKKMRAQKGDPTTVTVLSMGIPATQDLLRDCIARGADGALLLSDRAFAGADTLATTHALFCGLRKIGDVDLVLCGKMAVDGDTAQIGPELAGALDVPCVADVGELVRVDEERIAAWHATDEGRELVEVGLPAVLTISKDAASLRMPSIEGVLHAEQAHIAVMTAGDAGVDVSRIGLAGSPTQVVRSFVPERAVEACEISGTVGEQATRVAALIEEAMR